jgi:hypothetical protein
MVDKEDLQLIVESSRDVLTKFGLLQDMRTVRVAKEMMPS